MSTDRDVLRLALDVYRARLKADDHLPEDQRHKLARAAAERVLDAGAPAAVAWIERSRPRTQVNELQARRLRERARPHIDAVLAEAGTDVTERMLIGAEDRRPSTWPTVVPLRDRLCWLLAHDDGMTQDEVALVVRCRQATAREAIGRHESRRVAAGARRAVGHG